MFYPTMVVAVGDLAHRALAEAHELLQAFRSPALYITALAAYREGVYYEIGAPSLGDAGAFESPLARWLYATRLELNIHCARSEGMEVGPPGGYLLEQILLVVDSDAYGDALQMVQAVQELCERADDLVPARLHWLVLHPSYDAPLPTTLWQDHLARQHTPSALQEGKMYLLRLVRSDGSAMTPDQLRETAAYLLLMALHPAEFVGEHWLYRSLVDADRAPSTLGCGLVVLPLHKVIQCLQDKLVAEALTTLLSGSGGAVGLPQPDEAHLWGHVVGQAAQAWGEAVRLQPQDALGLTATIPTPALNPRGLSAASLTAVADWEREWHEQKLPRWRMRLNDAAQRAADSYRESLHTGVQQHLRTPDANLTALKARLETLASAVSSWQIHTLTPTRPSAERKTALRTRLEKSLAEAERFKGGLFRRRPAPDAETVNAYAQALHDYYAQSLRADAHEAFNSLAQQIRDAIQQQLHSVRAALERIQLEARERENRARAFHHPTLPWLRPLVYRWEHLESTAQALWGNRDLATLIRQLIDPERDLREQLPWITQQLEQYLQRWMTDYFRRFSYYLRERYPNLQSRITHCEQHLTAMREQAPRVLWRAEKPTPQVWQVAPPEERSSLPHPADAPIRDWLTDTGLGYIAVVGEVALGDVS
jgi:hypothetical protein